MTLTIFIVLILACHLFMMRGAHQGGKDVNYKMKGHYDADS